MINKHLAFLALDEDSPYTKSCLFTNRSAAFIIVVTQKLVLRQSKNVTAKCTETLSPPPSIQLTLKTIVWANITYTHGGLMFLSENWQLWFLSIKSDLKNFIESLFRQICAIGKQECNLYFGGHLTFVDSTFKCHVFRRVGWRTRHFPIIIRHYHKRYSRHVR